MTASHELITIQGYVQALPRAAHRDEAAKVAVVTDSSAVYHIIHKAAGVDLVDHIGATVEVIGTATPLPTAEGTENVEQSIVFSLLVRSYTLHDDFEDPWYDDSAN